MPCRSRIRRSFRPQRSKYARVYDMKTGRVKQVRAGDRPIRVYSQRKHDVVVIKKRDYKKFKEDEEKAKRHY